MYIYKYVNTYIYTYIYTYTHIYISIPHQLDQALVHNLFREHLLLVELSDELHVAQHALLGLDADQLPL